MIGVQTITPASVPPIDTPRAAEPGSTPKRPAMKSKSVGKTDRLGDSHTHIRRMLGASNPNVASQMPAVEQPGIDWVAIPGIPSVAVRWAGPLLQWVVWPKQSANTSTQSKGR